jgi:putative redox protein
MTKIDAATRTAGDYPVDVHVRSHTFACDASVAAGGADSAPGPHDLFDSALATCKAITAMWFAKHHHIPLERAIAHVESDATEERNGIYRMHVRVELVGPLTPEQHALVQGAIARCPIHKLMTSVDVQID